MLNWKKPITSRSATAKGGIRGIMIGDTAERLLREVGCSVLAVKPPDFVCPVEG
jgi:universal stress protein E